MNYEGPKKKNSTVHIKEMQNSLEDVKRVLNEEKEKKEQKGKPVYVGSEKHLKHEEKNDMLFRLKKKVNTFYSIYTIITIIHLLIYINRGIIPGSYNFIVNYFKKKLSLTSTDFHIGLLSSVFVLGLSISSILCGSLASKYSIFKITQIFLFLNAVALYFTGFAFSLTSYSFLMFSRFFGGFSEAAFIISIPSVIYYYSKDRAGAWISIFLAMFPLGGCVGYSMAVFLPKLNLTLSHYFIVLSLVFFVASMIFFLFDEDLLKKYEQEKMALTTKSNMEIQGKIQNQQGRNSKHKKKKRGLLDTTQEQNESRKRNQIVIRNKQQPLVMKNMELKEKTINNRFALNENVLECKKKDIPFEKRSSDLSLKYKSSTDYSEINLDNNKVSQLSKNHNNLIHCEQKVKEKSNGNYQKCNDEELAYCNSFPDNQKRIGNMKNKRNEHEVNIDMRKKDPLKNDLYDSADETYFLEEYNTSNKYIEMNKKNSKLICTMNNEKVCDNVTFENTHVEINVQEEEEVENIDNLNIKSFLHLTLKNLSFIMLVMILTSYADIIQNYLLYGASIFFGLDIFSSYELSNLTCSICAFIAATVGTSLGGLFVDQYDLNVQKIDDKYEHIKNNNKKIHLYRKDILVYQYLKIVGIQLFIFFLLASVFLLSLPFITNMYIFTLAMCFGLTLLFLTMSAHNIGIMVCVPQNFRPFSMGVSIFISHIFGDIPWTIILGHIKSILAPDCYITTEGTLHPLCAEQKTGLKWTLLIICSKVMIMTLGGLVVYIYSRHKIKKHEKKCIVSTE